MKRIVFILTSMLLGITAFAEHITGGEMYYVLTGTANARYQYHVTLKLYRDCFSAGAQLDPSAGIGVFNKSTGLMVWNELVPMRQPKETLLLTTPGPCITNAPTVCYEVGYYEFDLDLPASPAGYTVAYQRCCRINGINNLFGSGNTGATYTADIPGFSTEFSAPANNSARFIGLDTVIVCGGYPFTYSFAAIDPDPQDQLRYSFCDAWVGGSSGSQSASAPNPPASPPYGSVSYAAPYSSGAPLGPNVTINPMTGLISGISPPQGIYVVTVCVQEIRNGIVIATQRKDVQIKAGGCNLAKPQLDPEYITCDGFSYSFSHPSNPLIHSFYWDFGDAGSGASNISSDQNPTHVFSAAGDYTIKLVTNRNGDCSDSTTAIVRVWPGFFPNFNTAGICLTSPIKFNDATTTNYGVVDSWAWDFGDISTVDDTSHTKNTQWTYADTGTKSVQLIVTNSKGCKDTLVKTISVIDKPPITLAFKDTLICVPDAVQLQASGTGNFTWTPGVNITNANTGTPTVNPTSTTTYHVELNQGGCINTDTVRVRVVNFVTLVEMGDTTICKTDEAQLHVVSDALHYQWSPAASLDDPAVQNPVAISGNSETYVVIATIGSCSAQKDINVNAVPYPLANAGPDTTICYNTPASLHGVHDGNQFFWSPVSSLMNATTLNPTAYPPREGLNPYVLTSTNIPSGCPKPGRDTVVITVLPRIRPFAGNDTLVVVGQPVQLNAEGGVSYAWTPPTALNDPNIKNPVAVYGPEMDSVLYIVQVFNEAGCFDTASVKVTVFKTVPYVFVPTGFTPNGDGLNDVIRPIAVGVAEIKYFRIFNRWGQMVFQTTKNGDGWDGRIDGKPQGTNVYVWMVSAVDYLGKPIFLKGTVTLIR